MSAVNKHGIRPTLRSVLGRGHLSVALLAVGLVGISLTVLGVVALRAYANHNLHLIARSINYTVEAAVVFGDSAAANESLQLIASTEEVADAKVFNNDGEQLAHWQRSDDGMLGHLEARVATALLDEPINLPVMHQQQKVGHIELIGQGRSLLLFLLSGLGASCSARSSAPLSPSTFQGGCWAILSVPCAAWPASPTPRAGSAASIDVYRKRQLPS